MASAATGGCAGRSRPQPGGAGWEFRIRWRAHVAQDSPAVSLGAGASRVVKRTCRQRKRYASDSVRESAAATLGSAARTRLRWVASRWYSSSVSLPGGATPPARTIPTSDVPDRM